MIRHSLSFGIPHRHTDTRVRNTTSAIHFIRILLSHLITTQEAYFFYISVFITRNRETIINPQERADLHLVIRFSHLFHTIGTETDYFTGTYIMFDFIPQVRETICFTGCRISTIFLTNHNRCTSPLVTSSYDTVFGKNQHRTRTLNFAEHIFNAIHKVLTLYNKQCYQLCLIRLRKAHLGKMHILFQQVLFQFRHIIDFRYCNDCKLS